MKTGTKIRMIREMKGMTQDTLAKLVGYSSRSAVSRVEANDYDLPQSKLVTFAQALGVSPLDLIEDSNDTFSLTPSVILSDEVEISEIAQVAAGFDKAPLSNFEYDRFSIPRVYLRGHDAAECFIIRVKGDSMYPLYVEGDRVLARRADALDYSGEIGLVQDGETATIKKVEFGSGWLRLVPINPNYAPRTIKGIDLEQVRIIGIPMVLLRELEEQQ